MSTSAREIDIFPADGLRNFLTFCRLPRLLYSSQRPLGVVIAIAMLINLIAGALGGILIPQALHRLDMDPAVSSSPFVTTVTDVVGFFSFLGIATLWFGLR